MAGRDKGIGGFCKVSYTKIHLDCPKCSHEWDEHLPIMDKLTDIMSAASDLHHAMVNNNPSKNYHLTRLGKALSKIED